MSTFNFIREDREIHEAMRVRDDVREDMNNRRLLGMPMIDFDPGEPCYCAFCELRGARPDHYRKSDSAFGTDNHSSF